MWGRYREELKLDYTHEADGFPAAIPALRPKYRSGAGGYYVWTSVKRSTFPVAITKGLLVMVKAKLITILKPCKDLDSKVVAVKSGTGSVDYAKATSKLRPASVRTLITHCMELGIATRRRRSARYAEHLYFIKTAGSGSSRR
ncbi:hypothetical protein KCP78_02845 [Salmonella enterica subsp. enterica]|nr:hypothetical protein KCP78_02845 [Salmonella enterica subsp. enterica]